MSEENLCPDTQEAYNRTDQVKQVVENLPQGQPTPVRNHKYMTRVLDQILVAWTKAPQLRLGQLLENSGSRYSSIPMYYVEDDMLAEAVHRFQEEFLCGTGSDTSST